jgi:hypothetical protein
MLCVPGIISAQTTTKKFDHYAGIQVNQLLKQIINLNQNNAVIDNPYLLEYSIIQNKTNIGLRVGVGYTYSKSNNAENPNANLLEENDLSMYFGVCKRVFLGSKFELTYGLDYFNDYLSNKSYSYTVSEFGTVDSSYFQNNLESKSNGVGFDVSFRYAFSNHILVGTQLTYAYKWSSEKTHDLVFTHSVGFPSETNSLEVTNSYFKSSEFALNLPVAIYLVFKF